MKFFKCLSKNVSFVEEEKTKSRRKQKLKLKSSQPQTTNGEVTVPRKSRGLSVRFANDGDKQYSNDQSLMEDSIRVHVGGLASKPNQTRPVVKNTSCGTDFNSLPPVYDNPVFVDDNLDQQLTIDPPSYNFSSILDGSVMSPIEKVHMFLSRMDGETSDEIYDASLWFVDSTVTPKNRKWRIKLLGSKGHEFHDRFPQIPENDGTIICQQSSAPGYDQSTLSFNCSPINDMKRLVDYSLCSTSIEEPISDRSKEHVQPLTDDNSNGLLCSTLQEAVGVSDSDNIDYFNLNERELDSCSSEECDEEEDVNESCSARGSRCWDSVIMGPERLFEDADDSQVVTKNIPPRESKIKTTVFRDENGFGFSLGGERPPVVTRVIKDSPADKAGIMKGDLVLKVNNRKTYKSTCNTVDRFIRVIDPKYLILELYRDYQAIEICKDVRDGLTRDRFLEETRSDDCADESTPLATGVSKSPSEPQSQVNIGSSESTKSTNSIHIQEKLVFAPHLWIYQPYVDIMHLVYQGTVYQCNEEDMWIKHELILFSEALLMTSEMPGGSLFVYNSPINMQDLAGLEINRTNSSEFVLHLRKKEVSKKPTKASQFDICQTMILRAASTKNKFVWMCLLEQRVSAVTGRRLNVIIPTEQSVEQIINL